MLSNAAKLIIAKSNHKIGEWLPLWIHSCDTAKMIEFLIYKRFQHSCDDCAMDYDEFRKTAILLAYLHDIGKITPLFQSRLLSALPNMRTAFEHNSIRIPFESELKKPHDSHHTKCGEAILLSLGFPCDIASIVGAHHGMPANDYINHIEVQPNHFFGIPNNREFWNVIYKEWADFSMEHAGFGNISEIPSLNKRTQVLLSGLIVMSDWLASNQENFPLLNEDEFWSNYPNNRFDKAVEKLDLPDVWESEQMRITDDDFTERFGFSMNEVQKSVIGVAEKCRSAGLYILEAPMGIGKTEAALSAAEIAAKKCNKNGLFFGLPTQATANGIFERVEKWANLQSSETFHSINLAHGNAEFMPDFARLKSDSVDLDGDCGLMVHSFFSGSKQSLLADFVVGTVDRLLMAVLKKKHAMLLHLGLSQKVVIVDECHAYDAYMSRYLDRALEWLRTYNVPVILLSATLPPERRRELIRAYLGCVAEDVPDMSYPRLTYTDGNDVKVLPLTLDVPSKCVNILRAEDNSVEEEIKRAVKSGACVGIICNIVSRAQHFAEIAREIDGANVILYHAQFVIPDRTEKEDMLIKTVGKHSVFDERKGTVVVGTQVLEQSLDIDFDLLITDLCPMDLILQRIGRLHRHPRTDRPPEYNRAKCIVLGTSELDRRSVKIYTEWLLMRTNSLLPEVVNVPEDIDPLVCDTYKTVEPNSGEERKALDEYNYLRGLKKQNAKTYLMPPPKDKRRNNDLHDWLNNSVTDSENTALAAVRDGISSIEVIVMVQHSDGTLEMLPWYSNGVKYNPGVCPSEDECKLIARQKIRLPSAFCHPWSYEKSIRELEGSDKHLTGFQGSRWLKGELVLLLDENLSAELCGYKITYSRDGGLEYKKEELI